MIVPPGRKWNRRKNDPHEMARTVLGGKQKSQPEWRVNSSTAVEADDPAIEKKGVTKEGN